MRIILGNLSRLRWSRTCSRIRAGCAALNTRWPMRSSPRSMCGPAMLWCWARAAFRRPRQGSFGARTRWRCSAELGTPSDRHGVVCAWHCAPQPNPRPGHRKFNELKTCHARAALPTGVVAHAVVELENKMIELSERQRTRLMEMFDANMPTAWTRPRRCSDPASNSPESSTAPGELPSTLRHVLARWTTSHSGRPAEELPQHGHAHRLCRLRDHAQHTTHGQKGTRRAGCRLRRPSGEHC